MSNLIRIGNADITVKEYRNHRVVTFKDIDMCHQRPEGTARKRFSDNRKRFTECKDYFKISPSEFRTAIGEMDERQQNDIALITESGYLMLTKSLTDDLAWDVQRALVDTYFRKTGADISNLSPLLQVLINIEVQQKAQQMAIDAQNRRMDDQLQLLALSPTQWRKDASRLVSKIAQVMGGTEHIADVYNEIYGLVNERGGVSLKTRVTNKQQRMAAEGVCKSKRDKLCPLDVISDDKKLIEIYIAIVKEIAVKYSVSLDGEVSQ